MREELLKGLTAEQIEKASHCKNQAELIALAKKEGVELTDEQLKSINGGFCVAQPRPSVCPQCGAVVTGEFVETTPGDGRYHFVCGACGYEWSEK